MTTPPQFTISIMEEQRRQHELMDTLENHLAKMEAAPAKKHRERLAQKHLMREHVNTIVATAEGLLRDYDDANGTRKSEKERLQDRSLDEYYRRLQGIYAHHAALQADPSQRDRKSALDEALRQEPNFDNIESLFSGEERNGRYLDLNMHHRMYTNLKDVDKVHYLEFLDCFDNFTRCPEATRHTTEYCCYLRAVQEYLRSFLEKTNPLHDFKRTDEQIAAEYKKKLQKTKEKAPLFCEPCKRNFAKETVYQAHLGGRKHMKAETQWRMADEEKMKTERGSHDRLWLETSVRILMDKLESFREETKQNVERKQSRTVEEREDDLEEEEEQEEAVEEQEESDDEPAPYNPLKLPMGWDGKPIPYWLYKLHGLGVEHPCEICANQVYMGVKAFEKHFQESKHMNNLRNLGIPYSRKLYGVTSIEQARLVYYKIVQDAYQDHFDPDTMEEFEDKEGNVYSKAAQQAYRMSGYV